MRFKFFRRKKWLVALIAVCIVGGVAYAALRVPATTVLAPIAVKRGSVAQEIIVTGKTKPVESVDLAFEKTGTIIEANMHVGDKVASGTVLARLDTSELQATLQESRARVDAAQAKLDALKAGSRPEDIQVTRTDLAKAQQDLANDYTGVTAVLADSYAKADDAIRNQMDPLFTNGNDINPHLTFSLSNSQLQTDIETMRFTVGSELARWKTEIGAISVASPQSDADTALTNAENRLTLMAVFLNKISDALSGSITLSPSTLSAYKTSVNTARTSVNSALTNASNEQQTILSQKLTVKKTIDELNVKLAGASVEDIRAQVAAVAQAAAQLQSAEAQIAKSTLRAPIAGTVTKQDAKVGQIANPNAILVSIISENNLDIEANVPEVDIGNVGVGDPVHFTLDALPGETFEGKVFYIDPAETVVDGVVNFKVKIALATPDARVKSGLTANLRVETQRKENVLLVPQFAVIENDKGTFVRKKIAGSPMDMPVIVGIRGRDGMVEIVSGVNEGDEIENIGAKASQ